MFEMTWTFCTIYPKTGFDSTFISLDVTSLYTNITHDSGIEAISYWIDQYPSHLVEERFTKEFIVAGLTLVLKNNYFKFNGKMWHQLVGTTMGSNVSVIFAILFMAYLEIHIYQNVRQMYPQDYAEYLIKAWKRFIDDCFLIWNKKFDFTPFFYMVNNLDPSITFTTEEDNKALPFLDIMVIKITTIPSQQTSSTNPPTHTDTSISAAVIGITQKLTFLSI